MSGRLGLSRSSTRLARCSNGSGARRRPRTPPSVDPAHQATGAGPGRIDLHHVAPKKDWPASFPRPDGEAPAARRIRMSRCGRQVLRSANYRVSIVDAAPLAAHPFGQPRGPRICAVRRLSNAATALRARSHRDMLSRRQAFKPRRRRQLWVTFRSESTLVPPAPSTPCGTIGTSSGHSVRAVRPGR